MTAQMGRLQVGKASCSCNASLLQQGLQARCKCRPAPAQPGAKCWGAHLGAWRRQARRAAHALRARRAMLPPTTWGSSPARSALPGCHLVGCPPAGCQAQGPGQAPAQGRLPGLAGSVAVGVAGPAVPPEACLPLGDSPSLLCAASGQRLVLRSVHSCSRALRIRSVVHRRRPLLRLLGVLHGRQRLLGSGRALCLATKACRASGSPASTCTVPACVRAWAHPGPDRCALSSAATCCTEGCIELSSAWTAPAWDARQGLTLGAAGGRLQQAERGPTSQA